MTQKVKACVFPQDSSLVGQEALADFNDSFTVQISVHQLDPLDVYLRMVNSTPKWINGLLSLRNKTVSFLGLKDVGNLGHIEHLSVANRETLMGTQVDIFVI